MVLTRGFALGLVLISISCTRTAADAGDTSTGSTQADTTTEPIDCDGFVSAPAIGPAVTVTITHEGIAPVYYVPQGCGGAIGFEITAIDGGQTVRYDLGECSPVLCDDFLGASDCNPGCNDCAPPGGARFEPGGSGQGTWPGAWLVPFVLPEQCSNGAACQETCQRRDQAPAGRYEIALTVYDTCTGGCECEETPVDGICNLYGGTQLGYSETFVALIDYPAETTASIVISD